MDNFLIGEYFFVDLREVVGCVIDATTYYLETQALPTNQNTYNKLIVVLKNNKDMNIRVKNIEEAILLYDKLLTRRKEIQE